MLYTLLKFLGWGALLAFIGGCIGWALRALKCRGEVARALSSTVDVEEADHMRHRLANLDQVVAERDRLRIQLADVRHADSPGIVGAEIPEAPEPDPAPEPEAEPEPETSSDAEADAAPEHESDVEPEHEPDAEPEPEPDAEVPEPVDEATSIVGDTDAADDDAVSGDGSEADQPDAESAAPDLDVDLDLDAAAAELGKKIKLDDLTVVEGIGPKISELCSGIGVTTWRQLAAVDVDVLQSMLDAAGSRYAVHKPATWPRQAALLATGQWAEFKSLTRDLGGGK